MVDGKPESAKQSDTAGKIDVAGKISAKDFLSPV
jgi:hypothetical protein